MSGTRLMAAVALTLLLAPLAAPVPLRAFDFPTGVVRIVVPYLPGGSAEAQARFLAAELQKQWGKPVNHREQAWRRHDHRCGLRGDTEARRIYSLSGVHLPHRHAKPLQVAAL